MQRRNKPEVLAPAGNLRGLKTAVDYGADAVYCGGKAFGMRSAPKNLSLEDFEEGSRYAHERGARVYVTCNVLPRNNEVEAMREYIGQLKDTGVDALIVSDIGVMLMAREVAPNLELHVSTQAGVTNYQAANAFYQWVHAVWCSPAKWICRPCETFAHASPTILTSNASCMARCAWRSPVVVCFPII